MGESCWIGQNVQLMPMSKQSIAAKVEWSRDSDATRSYYGYAIVPHRHSELERRLEPSDPGFMVEIRKRVTDRVLGWASLYDVCRQSQRFSFAVKILTEHAGNGYGREAVSMLLRYAFTEMNLNRCVSRVAVDNEASKALHESLGFTLEGVLRSHNFTRGRFVDVNVYGLLRSESE